MMLRKSARVLAATAAAVAVSCSGALADGKMGTATIKGKVFAPEIPAGVRGIDMNADKFCAAQHQKPQMPQGKMVFKDNSLPYAFVYIKSGIEGKYGPAAEVVLDQRGCMYSPHVLGMIAGTPLKIVNSDDTNHNVHSLPTKNRQFNFSQPKKGMEKVLSGNDTFNNPEIMVRVKCDVHPWMSAYIGVLPHPFFHATGRGGEFEIKNVPAGKYTLAVWHEEWGAMETEIEVADGATVEKELKYEKKAASAAPIREVTLPAVDR